MMKKFIFLIIIALFLVSCGSDKTGSLSSGTSEISKVSSLATPRTTVQSVLSTMEKGRYRAGEVIVKFRQGVSASAAGRVHQVVGGQSPKKFPLIPDIEVVTLPSGMSVKDAIISYMADPNVEYAEPNYIRRINALPNDLYFNPQQWALNNTGTFANGTAGADIKAPQAWDATTGGNSIVIAVLDSGVDYTHQDLVTNIFTNTGETSCTDGIDNDGNGYIDDCKGWDFSTCDEFDVNPPFSCTASKPQDNDPMDELGHGTHVAGTIGAVGNNGTGVAGVMWNVQLMPLKFLNANGEGTIADEISAINYAVLMKNRGFNIKAINASFSGSEFSNSEFSAISSANGVGILIIASAGNGGSDSAGDNNDFAPEYPANYQLPNIISVAATDQNDHRAPFSNFGVQSVHVAAPGVYILSTVPPGVTFSLCTGSAFAGYDFCSGTSMAAPHVAGLVGLLSSYYPGFTSVQTRSTILRYVDTLPELTGWIQTGGKINAYKAVSSLFTPTNLAVSDKSSSSVTLLWNDNATGEDGYTVERSDPGAGFVQIATIGANSTSFTDTGLASSTTYSYRVRAFNTIPAESAYSNETAVTTNAPGSGGGGGGGGGGCSLGGRQNAPTAIADLAMLLVPLALIALMRRRR